MMTNKDIEQGIEKVYRYNLRIRKNEKILIIGDHIPKNRKNDFKKKFNLADQDVIEIQDRCKLSNEVAKVGQRLYGTNAFNPVNLMSSLMSQLTCQR